MLARSWNEYQLYETASSGMLKRLRFGQHSTSSSAGFGEAHQKAAR
jgi:hypothetical protein